MFASETTKQNQLQQKLTTPKTGQAGGEKPQDFICLYRGWHRIKHWDTTQLTPCKRMNAGNGVGHVGYVIGSTKIH